MATTTKPQYQAIIRAGVDAASHSGDFAAISDFGVACYNDNSVSELLDSLAALKRGGAESRASRTDWKITIAEFRSGITEALEQCAYDFEEAHNFENRD